MAVPSTAVTRRTHEVEERGIAGERARDAARGGAEHQPVHACHHVHVQTGPVEEPGIQVPLVEAHGPLDDPRLVGMIEIRQTVRDAPGAERQPDGKNEEEPEPNSPLAPVLGRAASGRGVATPGHIPRWKLWFPKGSPHASPLTSVAPGQRMRASPRAASSSSSLASGGPVCEPQGRQDDVPAALDVQYATRALYNGQFRHPGRARPARCRMMRFWDRDGRPLLAPLGFGDQSRRCRMETSSVRVW